MIHGRMICILGQYGFGSSLNFAGVKGPLHIYNLMAQINRALPYAIKHRYAISKTKKTIVPWQCQILNYVI